MKKAFKIILIIGIGISVILLLINRLFFKSHLDKQPEIVKAKYSEFAFESEKPIFYSIENKMYFHQNGEIKFNDSPILKMKVEEVYMSPNGKFAAIYSDNKITLIDNEGKTISSIKDCTDLHPTDKDRKSGRFLGNNIQWTKTQNFS